MAKKSAKQQFVRITNQNLIIDTIRQRESATRSELSKLLNLSVPSVCTNVDQLVELGIVRETEDASSGVGRKASRLRLNDQFGYIIAVDLSNPCVTVAIANLKPEIVQELKFDIEQYELGQLMELLTGKIEELLTHAGVSREQLLMISISVPGQVDGESGLVKCGSYLESLGTVNFREPLSDRFLTKVLLQKDINAAIIGEMSFGSAQGCSNAVFLSADVGLGLGIVLDGRLYPGSFHASGEIAGYLIRTSDAAPVRLQDQVSIGALVRDVRAELAAGAASSLHQISASKPVGFNDIMAAVFAGDDLAVRQVKKRAQMLAAVVVNLLQLLDLDTIVLGGGFVSLGPAYTDTLREEVKALMPFSKAAIVHTALKTKAVLIGGVAIGLEMIFNELLEEAESN
ncbi:ROK family transcriptional regulator [Paenibacillus radicis (ex Gao et al. 2016)]|uniref:Transcriptional regulator n=1 Tax=Paenibacillus radicis (ex Gao et al. 2016) TaxID=1737354 RepID=A0A917HHI1_9BACL|nr:ROK family transcriptional regulator [Paenibacillus radicis (ex Gao et al. 2016)]GGG78277.1 transcriptional regulator [Paenibacillus radicis (ex Gao et al. 2016)]